MRGADAKDLNGDGKTDRKDYDLFVAGQSGGTTPPPAGGTTPPPAGGTTPPPAGGTTPPPTVAKVSGAGIPQGFALGANYPNPFNPETTIGYQLPAAAQVRLEIYDALGQKVRTLVQQVEPAGYHTAVWDGRDDGGHTLAGGVYLYRLQADEFSQVRKLLLMK